MEAGRTFGLWSHIPESVSLLRLRTDRNKSSPSLGSPGPPFCHPSTKMLPGKKTGSTSASFPERPEARGFGRHLQFYRESEGGLEKNPAAVKAHLPPRLMTKGIPRHLTHWVIQDAVASKNQESLQRGPNAHSGPAHFSK